MKNLSFTTALLCLVEPHQAFHWQGPPFSRFVAQRQRLTWSSSTAQRAAKGFGSGGGGFGAKAAAPKKKPSKQAVLKKIKQAYGGTSPQEIAAATQRRVEDAIRAQPPHLQMALQIYQQLQTWDAQLARLSVLQQANLPSQEVEGAQRARDELQRIYAEHHLDDNALHNLLQQITWDASADAKAARAIAGSMPSDIVARVDRAAAMVAEAVGDSGRCLDVGCGFGVLVPHLTKAGLSPQQIHGLDLSSEMIRNAKEQHPGVRFESADFFKEYHDEIGFECVIFCAALHDMPDVMGALRKAAELLKPSGKLVVVHPQGASHVLKQALANPVLVKRGLPDAEELRRLEGMELGVEPTPSGSDQDNEEGYLAVLQKSS